MAARPARALPPAAAFYQGAPWVAVLMVAVIVVRLHEGIPGIRLVKPALVVSAAAFAVLLSRSKRGVLESALRDPIVRRFGLFFGWAAVTAPFALWMGQAIGMLLLVFPSALLLIAILLCPPTRDSLTRLLTGLVAACAVSGVVLIAAGNYEAGRLSGLESYDSNDLALLMAMCVPFALSVVVYTRGARRLLAIVATAIMVFVVVKTQSRGGVLALGIGVTTFVLGLRGAARFAFIPLIFAAAAATWAFAPQDFRDRMASIGKEDYNYTEYSGRKQIWARARGYIAEHPVAGVGIGNFSTAEGNYCSAHNMTCKWSATHNTYLQVTSELGFVGIAFFLSMIAYAARHALAAWRGRPTPGSTRAPVHRPELLAALVAYLAAAYFLSAGYFYALFGLLGIIALGARVIRADAEAAEADDPALAAALAPAAVAGTGWRTARSGARAGVAAPRATRGAPALGTGRRAAGGR